MAPLLLDHLSQLSGQAQSVGWGGLQGELEEQGKEMEVVSQWYNLHASWGQNVAALIIEKGTRGTDRLSAYYSQEA